ncbi:MULTISPECIES: molybdopterin molybdotransferase MoeA [unclassified Brevibacterium]|uniref:molybdopterin molybdotransferase MoeA n=1 Tax=unclassified Brevibacterium TaxID=2614124 RepID=UPI001E5A982A|nr:MULTISPECIES: molybdopterin molybdotransferase MoeA [unclassified Brevibacterium]MDK8435633.1 molybdopterin molybdotransferase MoeA [Brevibacterium sp. H-BE7]
MTTPIMHRSRVLETIAPLLETRSTPIGDLLDAPRLLTEDVESAIDVPGFDNSSMDGYAVATATLEQAPQEHRTRPDGSRTLVIGPIPVAGRVAAGARGAEVAAGTAVEIMTGAPLPAGTDTVIRIEDTEPGAFESSEITVAVPAAGGLPQLGSFVRARGSDVRSGQRVLSKGTRLTPAHLGVAASCGIRELPVLALPRVLVVSTGDEILAEAAAGIHDANSVTLTAALRRLGVEVEILRVPDDPGLLLERVRQTTAELVISTGGISKGAYEVVKLAAAADPGSSMVFDPITMQPGGPQGCGRLADRPWVALPGNPVSTLISFEMFIRPALLGLGTDDDPREVEFHRLPNGLDEPPPAGKLQVRRARLSADGLVLVGGSRSHLLGNYALSDRLLFVPAGYPHHDPADPFAPVDDMLRTWKIE